MTTTAANAAVLDMSTKIGGRIVKPALPVVDSNAPNALEISFDENLKTNFSNDNIPLESTEGIQRRERVLNRMGAVCRDWIRTVCKKRGLPREVVESAGGQLFTSGSYRLGVLSGLSGKSSMLICLHVSGGMSKLTFLL